MKPFLLFIFWTTVQASTVRVMTYNLLNYENDNSREDEYRNIIEFVEPNLLMVQEVIGTDGYDHFLSDVLNQVEPDEWEAAPFSNQSAQQDIALYYQSNLFTFVSTSTINTASSSGLRDVVEFVMIHNASNIEFNIYGVHLKASSGDENAAQRLEEATILRNYLNDLPSNAYFMVVGDFNIYSSSSSSEPAFNKLTGDEADNDGRLFDPVNRIGHWHNNDDYADVHTQSPRTSSFGGGANGGMDDRFDWIFASASILDPESDMMYVEETYWAVGNDGNHFNQAINNGTNSSVTQSMANTLHDASDHLPVIMDVYFNDLVYTDGGIVITEIMPNPAAVSDSYGEWFEIYNTTDTTIDIHNWVIKDADSDLFTITNDAMSVPVSPGEFFVLCRSSDLALNGNIDVDYEYSSIALANSEDELILTNALGEIIDEVHYTNSWAFGSGVSMELHNVDVENNDDNNWYAATLTYGSGDYGTPGTHYDGTLEIESSIEPSEFLLGVPYPNPFNPETKFQLRIANESYFVATVFDLSGRQIEILYSGVLPSGAHEFKWSPRNLSSGIYFIQGVSEKNAQVQKVMFIQ